MLRLSYVSAPDWPPGAWLARCPSDGGVVEIVHGRHVETAPDWFCEATWSGPYAAGEFDRTDVVFGSGGRLRPGILTFVSSASTVDRLQSLTSGDVTWVSNSLACLVGALRAEIDPTDQGYIGTFTSITQGLSRYHRTLETTAGTALFTYFENLVWDGASLRVVAKPIPERDFGSFAAYHSFLDRALEGLATNMTDSARATRYRMVGTMSSGYDSATVATLARRHGLAHVFSFAEARSGEEDSGADVAAFLGLRLTVVPREAWRAMPLAEVPFLASDAKGEDVYFSGAADLVRGTVLLTGFHGDKMWDTQTMTLSPDIVRGDQSGLSLSEYRLRAGFIHVPVPFLGVRQIRDVQALSVAPEQAPWDVGGGYSRPLCRRIVEGAGVPRAAFGQRKKAVSVLFNQRRTFLSASSLADYLSWLSTHAGLWREGGLTPPRLEPASRSATRGLAAAAVALVDRCGGPRTKPVRRAYWYLVNYGRQEPLFRWLFPWALEHAAAAYPYRRPTGKSAPAPARSGP